VRDNSLRVPNGGRVVDVVFTPANGGRVATGGEHGESTSVYVSSAKSKSRRQRQVATVTRIISDIASRRYALFGEWYAVRCV